MNMAQEDTGQDTGIVLWEIHFWPLLLASPPSIPSFHSCASTLVTAGVPQGSVPNARALSHSLLRRGW
jgi:hypothetical protein